MSDGARGMMLITSLVLAITLVGAPEARAAGVPEFLNVQGVLYDNDGNPVDDTYTLTVSLYTVDSGGTPIFSKAVPNYTVENGIFHLSIPFTGQNPFRVYPQLWLGIKVDADAEMTPRQALTSVGYAMQALHADEASVAKDLDCTGAGCVARDELAQTYALGDGDQEALSAISLSPTKCVGCVQQGHIQDGGIATVDLADGSVTSAKIADGTIQNVDIKAGTITGGPGGNLGAGAVVGYNIAADAVTSDKIANGAVVTDALANLSVTEGKLANDAVTTDKILDGQVGTPDLADNAVITQKILNGSVTDSKIGQGIPSGTHFLPATGTDIGPVIVGDYISVDGAGRISIDIATLNPDLQTGLPVGQNLVQWESKTENWTLAAGAAATVVVNGDQPIHGGDVFRFNKSATWLYARDMIEVSPDREYFGRVYARKASGASAPTFAAGYRAFDKDENFLGDGLFMAPEDANPALTSVGKYFSGFVAKASMPAGTRFVQPVIVLNSFDDVQIDVDALEMYELTVSNDVACVGCVGSADIGDGAIATGDLANGAVTSAKIADGTIVSADIGAGGVATGNLANGAVATDKIADGAVTEPKLGDGAVTSIKILNQTIQSEDLAVGAVHNINILPGAVGAAQIAEGAVSGVHVLNNSLTAADLADRAVTAAELAANAVYTEALQDDAVTGAKIADNQVGAAHIGTGQVTTDEILNHTIVADDLDASLSWIAGGDLTVPNDKRLIFADDVGSTDTAFFTEGSSGPGDGVEVRLVLGNDGNAAETFTVWTTTDGGATLGAKKHEMNAAGDAYHAGDLTVDGAIDAGSLTATGMITGNLQCPPFTSCIDSAEIEDGTIVDADVSATAAIQATKIQNTALTQVTVHGGDVSGVFNNLQIGVGAVGSNELAANAVTYEKMANNAVGTDELRNLSVTALKLADQAVTTAKIADGAVNSDKVKDESLTAVDLAPNSVGSSELATGAVGSEDILDGGIEGPDIGLGQIEAHHLHSNMWGASGAQQKIARSDHEHAGVDGYVKKSGDTMTGNLSIAKNGDASVTLRSNTGGLAVVGFDNDTGAAANDAQFVLTGDDTLQLQGANLTLPDANSTVSATYFNGNLECSGCVDNDDLGAGSITNAKVSASAAIAPSKIAGTALTQSTVFGGDVSGVYNAIQIGAGAIGAAELATNSVYTDAIQNGAVTTDKVANGAITGAKVADNSLLAADLGPNSVGASELADGAVDPLAIQNGAVTDVKLHDSSVNSAKIVDDSITTSDIQNGTIDPADLKFTVPGLGTDVTIADSKRLIFDDAGETSKGAFFKETTTGTGSIDVGLHLGYQQNATETFSVYSTADDQGSTKTLQHRFGADGKGYHKDDLKLGSTADDANPGAGLVFTGTLYKTNSGPGAGAALYVADYFEIRADNTNAPIGHSYIRGAGNELTFNSGDRGIGTLYLNRDDNGDAGMEPGPVVVGKNLSIGGDLTCTNCIQTGEIADGAVTTNDILNDNITSSDIGPDAVGLSELANGSVDENAIVNGVVTSAKIRDDSITGADILNNNITSSDIGPDAVGPSELANDSVDTGAIVDGVVNSAKIADNTVSSADILDNTIVAGDIATGAVTTAEILDGTITETDVIFSFQKPGGDITVNDGNRITFNDTGNDSGYLMEVSDPGQNNYELRMVLEDDANGSEKFTIGINKTAGAERHRMDSIGDAYHSRNLAVGGSIDLNGNLVHGGCDLVMDEGSCTGRGNGGRALVHDGSDGLTINYAGDFTGGTRIDGNVRTGGTLSLTSAGNTLVCTDCIHNSDIADRTIGAADIAVDAISATEIGANAVTGSELANNSVSTGHIVDGQVETLDLANNAVTSVKILDGQVADADLAGNISPAKITGTALTQTTGFDGDVSGVYNNLQLKANVVGQSELAGDAVTTGHILNGTIAEGDLDAALQAKVNSNGTGSDIHLSDTKRFIFDETDNDGGYFQELTSPNDNQVNIGVVLWDDGRSTLADTSERFTINAATDAGGSNLVERHRFRANGEAWHAGITESASEMRATLFRDGSSGFYVDPASTSYLNDVRGSIYYDRDDTNYYANPAGTSKFNDLRANIFYDRQDTGYYVDPNSSSHLYRTYSYWFVNKHAVSTDHKFGVYYASDLSAHYAIYREGGGWSHPYPDLHIAFHTGIKIGGHYTYGGTRFYNNSDMATEIMSVGNGDNNVRVANTLYASGNVQTPILYDLNDTGYYVDPAGVSYMSDVRAAIFYDHDTNYYFDGDSTTRMNVARAWDFYADDWFRNYNKGEGLYNQETQQHFYSQDASYWVMDSDHGMQLRDGHNGTVTGYLYWDGTAGSNNFGLLSPGGNWRVRVDNSNTELYGGVYMPTAYANLIYDREDTGYYLDPNATTKVYDVNAQCVARSTCPDGWMDIGDSCIENARRGKGNWKQGVRECSINGAHMCRMDELQVALNSGKLKDCTDGWMSNPCADDTRFIINTCDHRGNMDGVDVWYTDRHFWCCKAR